MLVWLFAEQLHIPCCVRIVEGFEHLEGHSEHVASATLERVAARLAALVPEHLHDLDVLFATRARAVGQWLGSETSAALVRRWRAVEGRIVRAGEPIRQSPIKSATSAIALLLALEVWAKPLRAPPPPRTAHTARGTRAARSGRG